MARRLSKMSLVTRRNMIIRYWEKYLQKLADETVKKLSVVRNEIPNIKKLQQLYPDIEDALNFVKSLAQKYNDIIIEFGENIKKVLGKNIVKNTKIADIMMSYHIITKQIQGAIHRQFKNIQLRY